MNLQPYQTPRSFHPNAPPSHNSSIPPYQNAGPAHTVSPQRQRQQQLQENISPQSYPTACQNHNHNGISSDEQRAAVLYLQEIPNSIFFGLLESIRSFSRGETAFYPDNLSYQQLQAFLALQGCSDELILTLRRFPGSIASSNNFYNSSTLSNGRVAADLFTQSRSLVSNASTCNTLNFPSIQSSYNLSRDSSVGLPSSSEASSNEHDRWCFICENSTQPFRTADGFKRHLREHFTGYYCILQEPLVDREDGPRCGSCNIPNPDSIHLNTHVTECVGRKFTRKSLLVRHLETKHHVQDGSALAGHSEYSVDLKYFACGFCVFCCGSLIELANHVDAHHYKFSQHIRHWDNEKVIRGLLSQPVVVECWQAILASNPPLQEPWLRRMPALVEQLKGRLELSREPAVTLCNAAMDAGNYRWNWDGNFGTMPANQGTVADQTIKPFESQDTISPLSFDSEQSHIAYPPQRAAAFPQSQSPAMDWNEARRCPQIASKTYELPASASHQHPFHRAQSSYPSNCGESFIQHQSLTSTAPASGVPQSLEARAWAPYTSKLGGHSSGLPSDIATNPGSRYELETYTAPAQTHAGWNYPASTMESVSSPSLRDHRISSQSLFNDIYSPRGHQPPASHSSRREPAQRRVIHVDSDSGDPQRLTQARGRRQRQRHDH